MPECLRVARRRLSEVVGAVILAALALPLHAQRATLERVTKQTILPNGLTVIVLENHGVPLATLEIVVKNGSFTQEPQDEGVAHLFEHMLFRSYTGANGERSFGQDASALFARYNGTTSEEEVTYDLTLPSYNVAKGIELLARMMRTAAFTQDGLDQERQVVLGEYERSLSSPFFHLRTQMGERLWGTAWSRKNTIGNRRALMAATPRQLETLYRRYYVPNNAALVVTGDVNPTEVFAAATRHFGPWARGADPFADRPIPQIPPLGKDQTVIVEGDVNDVTIALQWHGPSVGRDPEATYSADVFSDALNLSGSILQERLVESGLFQGLTVNYYTLNHTGPITISGQTTPDKMRRALSTLLAEVARFDSAGYFTDAELANVKKQRSVETAFGLERGTGVAHTIGFWWSVAGLEYFMGYVDNMATRTAEDLRRYARTYIVGRPKVIGVLLSAEANRAHGAALKHLLAGANGR